jgi:hypothetical protein
MKEILSKTEAAVWLGVSVSTFDRHVRPHLKDHSEHSRPRFKMDEIEAWMETQRVPPKVSANG